MAALDLLDPRMLILHYRSMYWILRFIPYTTAQNIVEAFRRTWPQALAEAPRFTNIALASLLTLIARSSDSIGNAPLADRF